MMQGILIVDKPMDWTSFDVVAKLRGVLGTRKLGHSGTLDPMATGVLPVFCGGASKAVDLQLNHDKTYRATLRLGARTDTGDSTGTVLETAPVTAGEKELLAVLPQFVGPQMQVPPMYSAVKINGQPLYKLAREGVTVERKTRPIEIYGIEYGGSPAENEYVLTVRCSKGTYIRTLLCDIGKALGGGAVMTALCRTKASGFTLEQCYTFEQVTEFCRRGTLAEHLIPTDRLFASLPELHLTEQQSTLYGNGVKLALSRVEGVLPEQDLYRVYGADGSFFGTAQADRNADELRVGKNLK